jgi:D-glycero-beta-D-manno-heptose 1-phosphate adenylyltransferase
VNSKIHTREELKPILVAARAAGKVVVWSNGSFDMLHPGHVSSLEAAKALGNVLVVGVNSDRSVKAYKGPKRPVLNERERATMLAALECVDYVTIFDEDTPEAALAELQPAIHCKGAEYAPPHGRPVPEAKIVEAYGGQVKYLPLVDGISTTDLIQRIRTAYGDEA